MALGVQFKIPKLLQDKTKGTTLVEVKGILEAMLFAPKPDSGEKKTVKDGEQ